MTVNALFAKSRKPTRLLDDGLDVEYRPGFLKPKKTQELLHVLKHEADWHRPAMKMYNQVRYTRRLVAWHADEGYVYQYSGQEHVWKDWTPAMAQVRALVEAYMGRSFNGVLLNYYADGSEYISPHADDERDMAPDVPIVAVSLGATRDFVLKHQNGERYVIPLESGSLVVMRGQTQQVAKHSIPKRAKVTGPRISLTFRQCIRKA